MGLVLCKGFTARSNFRCLLGPNHSYADWGDVNQDDLDAKWSFDTFFGKSFSEAEAMFQTNPLNYQEDLQSMPASAFNFYAPALAKYITSEHAKGDSDGASSFLHTVAWMLKTRRHIISPDTEELLVNAASRVARRQEFYEAALAIYGNFANLYAEIQELAGRGA